MRNTKAILFSVLICGLATTASGAGNRPGDASPVSSDGLQIEIQSPSHDFVARNGERTIEVEGVASTIGGVQYLDMMFVMDTSTSLRSTDPKDYRSAGAIGRIAGRSFVHCGICRDPAAPTSPAAYLPHSRNSGCTGVPIRLV
jgi:hypothetical protein